MTPNSRNTEDPGLAFREAFENLYPAIPWEARYSRDDWAEKTKIMETAWSAATKTERDRCCWIVYEQCESDTEAQRAINAIWGSPQSEEKEEGPPLGFWVIELTPAFAGHPSFPSTFYAGGREGLGSAELARVTDIDTAPRWKSKEAAERIVSSLLPTKSCVWRTAEYVESPAGPIRIKASDHA